MQTGSEITDSGPASYTATPARGQRILLAEDNAVNRVLVEEMLKVLGYLVETADDGLEVTQAAERCSYDLILMDCQMPELDGYNATRRIRTSESATGRTRTPIIALTGSAASTSRSACLEAGMDDFLSKPFTLSELKEIVSKWTGDSGGL